MEFSTEAVAKVVALLGGDIGAWVESHPEATELDLSCVRGCSR